MAQDELSELNKLMNGTPEAEKGPAPSKPMSVAGLAENTLNDGFDMLKGLYQIIPTVANSAGEIYKQRKYIPGVKMSDVGSEFGHAAVAVKDAILEPYQKHGIRVLYEKPVTAASDLLTLITLGGGSIAKTGELARAAGVANAERLITLGRAIESAPGRLARTAMDTGTLKLTGGKLDLAKRREFLALKAEEMSQVPLKIKGDFEVAGKKIAALSDDEAALFHKWRTQGSSAAEAGLSPKTMDALESWRKVNQEYTEILKGRRFKEGMFNDEHVQNVLERKYAAEVFGKIDEATMAEAKAAIQRAEVKPVYGPAMFEKKGLHLDDLIDEMLEVQGKKPKGAGVSFLEEYKGKEGAIADPRIYIPKHIQAFRNVEGRLRFRDRLLQSPELTGAPKGAKALEGAPPPGDISKHYYQDQMRWEQASQKITDPTIKRLLQMEHARATGPLKTVLRVYDQILTLFRKTATAGKIGPVPYVSVRYVTGNAVGDAILGTLAGAEWKEAQRLIKKGSMTPQVIGGGVSHEVAGVGGVIEKFTELAGEVDTATKAGIVVKAVRKELLRSGMSFEKASEALEPVLKSTQAFSNLQVEMQLLQENVARSSDKVRRLDAVIQRMEAKESEILRKYNEAYRSGNQPLQEAIYRDSLGPFLQKIENVRSMRSNIARDLSDDMVKTGYLEAKVPELRAQVAIVRPAVERANAFVGDYLGLDGFEQGVMRRLIPFYAWSKAMTMLAFRLPFLAPVKSFLWHRYSMAMMSMVGDKDLPEWMNGSVPVFARQNGDLVWLKLGSYSPFSGLRVSRVGNLPVPSHVNLAESSPLFNVAFKIMGGKTVFDRGTMPHAGESLIAIGDGTEYRWKGDGSVEKGMSQAPLVSSVAHMFPITQFLEEAILPFKVNKLGWGGIPEPQMNSDGTYRYPREWWQRLASAAGVNLQSRTKESIQRSGNVGKMMAIRAMKGAYRRANPEERQMILNAMKDYLHGEGD